MENIDLSQYPPEQLKAALAQSEAKKLQQEKKKREQYERMKEEKIAEYIKDSSNLNFELAAFKDEVLGGMKWLKAKMLEMGDAQDTERGNFTVKSADGNSKIEYKNHVLKEFDETVELAEQKLKEYLDTTVKKRNKAHHEMIMQLLERGGDGKLNPELMGKLLSLELKINHPVFSEAVKLFGTSYKEVGSKTYIRFYKKDGEKGWDNISLNFSSI